MENKCKGHYGTVIGIAISCAIGAVGMGLLLHILPKYNLGEAIRIISVSGRSVFEHLKMLIVPIFLLTLIEYAIYGRSYGNFFSSRLAGTLLGTVLMVTTHYTFYGIVGGSYLWFDILNFVSAVNLVYFITTLFILKKGESERPERREIISVLGLVGAFAFVIAMPYMKVQLPIFEEIIKHRTIF